MPNYCENQLHFDCTDEEFEKRIKPFFLSGEDYNGEHKELTFNVLVPMPPGIYRGPLGLKERQRYGQNNWFAWCCEYWGTKWDAFDICVNPRCVSFTTAWAEPAPWYRELARRLKASGITAHADYYREGGFPGSLGGYDLCDGELIETEASDEFASIYEEEEEEE